MISPATVFKFDLLESLEGCDPTHLRCARAAWQVKDDLPYLEGHFPGRPIVPAIAFLDASIELLRRLTPTDSEIPPPLKVKAAKFLAPISPGMCLTILCHHISPAEWRVEWRQQAELENPERSVVTLTLIF